MLVVVVIVGMLASTVALGFVGSDREQNLRTEAERLAELIEMARSEAVQRNEEWGLTVQPDGVSVPGPRFDHRQLGRAEDRSVPSARNRRT